MASPVLVTRAAPARSTMPAEAGGNVSQQAADIGRGAMSLALLRAAAVAAISLVMALPAVAQEHLTTLRPYNPLVIPDNPCMTPAQRKKLQLLRDEWALEYDHEAAAFEQLDALEKLDNAIAVAEKGFFETADTQHKYEAAKAQYKSMGGRAAQGRFLKQFMRLSTEGSRSQESSMRSKRRSNARRVLGTHSVPTSNQSASSAPSRSSASTSVADFRTPISPFRIQGSTSTALA